MPAGERSGARRRRSVPRLPDLSYPEPGSGIEYDGDVHRTDPATWRRDVERRQRLEDAGWIVVTATADD